MLLLLNPNNDGVLRIDLLRNGLVDEFAGFLRDLGAVFNHLYALDLALEEAEKAAGQQSWRRRSIRSLRTIRVPADVVLGEDRIRLYRIQVTSPGWLDVIGKWNVLEVVRQYLNDRHERSKDASYRIDAEKQRLALDNQNRALALEKLKTDVLRDRMQLMRELGIPEARIREVVQRYFARPVDALDELQDRGLIGGARRLGQEELGDRQET